MTKKYFAEDIRMKDSLMNYMNSEIHIEKPLKDILNNERPNYYHVQIAAPKREFPDKEEQKAYDERVSKPYEQSPSRTCER